ncbi:MAG: YcgL domain-containing protein [Verrucomicrobiota bacterium]
MTVDVYQTNKKDIYLFLRSGEPFSTVPQSVRDTVELLQFVNDMEFVPDKSGTQRSEILAELEKQGYSIHGAKFRITEHE